MPQHIVVMGVCGCGKTTVAHAISERLGYAMAEGDDLHPKANVEKMAQGIPLNDEDRLPWLRSVNAWMAEHERRSESTVVSCSALKRSYRGILAQGLHVLFLHEPGIEVGIEGSAAEVTARAIAAVNAHANAIIEESAAGSPQTTTR